ncbi:MAG: DUF2062 domain-containing protein [Rhizobiaceae bacterium]|jgi:hypothetical protein|nr:DUF2062 domain-containing protein [Rhizobiaceae bacterium]
MLFRRRNPLPLARRLHRALVPSRSLSRSVSYFKKRVLRLSATPHAIAAGVAAGAMASFTPLLGFHFLLAFALAFILRGNMVAAALGTAVGNPLTFPLIFAATHRTGRLILGDAPLHAGPGPVIGEAVLDMEKSLIWEPILKPMLVGAVPLALVAGAVLYAATHVAVSLFQKRRSARLAGKRSSSDRLLQVA